MIGPWQHRVHMRSSFASMSAAMWSRECTAPPVSQSLNRAADAERGVTAVGKQDRTLANAWKVAKVCPKSR